MPGFIQWTFFAFNLSKNNKNYYKLFRPETHPKPMGTSSSKEDIVISASVKEVVKLFVKESHIVWHDPNINSQQNIKYLNGLQESTCDLKTFTDWNQAATYLQGVQTAVQVITSGTDGELLVKEISNVPNVFSVFVFCSDIDHHNQWTQNYPKVVSIEKSFEKLMFKMEQNMMTWQRQISSLRLDFPAFAPIFEAKDITELNSRHLYLKGHVKFENRAQAKRDFLALSKEIYYLNFKDDLADFDKNYNEYKMDTILTWYSKESFLYKVTNNCLRIATSDAIQYCRLVLKDLETAIREHYQKKSKNFNGLLYRGAYLSDKEWTELTNNIGKEIEMYGFLSTSKAKEKALYFAAQDITRKIFITIIVPAIVGEGEQSFAEIKEFSKFPSEEEVLFNVRSRFTILEATREEINGSACRHLVLLYGAQTLRRVMRETDPFIEAHLSKTENRTCQACQRDLKEKQEEEYYLFFNRYGYYICCKDCLQGFHAKINHDSPLLCISSFSQDFLKASEKNESIKKEGLFLQSQQVHNIPFYGYECTKCEKAKLECYFTCLACKNSKKVWCNNCFYQDSKCFKEKHASVLEFNPCTFWTEKMSDGEWSQIEYQKETQSEDFSLFKQGETFFNAQNFEKARKYYEEFLKRRGNKKNEATGGSYCNLGLISQSLGSYEEAIKFHSKALEIYRVIHGEFHKNTANAYNNLGMTFRSMAQYDEAEEYHSRALKIRKALYGEQHHDLAMSYNNLGNVYSNLQRYEESEECHREALRIRESIYGETHPDTGMSCQNLGGTLYFLRKYQQAMEYCQRGLAINKAVYGENHSATASSHTNIGAIYQGLGQYRESKEHRLKALMIRRSVYGENHSETGVAYCNYGEACLILDEREEAEKYLLNAVKILKATLGEDHPTTLFAYQKLESSKRMPIFVDLFGDNFAQEQNLSDDEKDASQQLKEDLENREQHITISCVGSTYSKEMLKALSEVEEDYSITRFTLEKCNADFLKKLLEIFPALNVQVFELHEPFNFEILKTLELYLPKTRLKQLEMLQEDSDSRCELVPVIRCLPSTTIQELILPLIGIETFEMLINVLPNSNIKQLWLPFWHDNDQIYEKLSADFIKTLPKTKLTCLKWGYLREKETLALAQVLSQTQITHLDLNVSCLGEKEFNGLTKALPGTKIKYLGLTHMSKPINLGEFIEILPNTVVETLNLDGHLCSFDDIVKLLQIVPDTKLRVIDFTPQHMGYEPQQLLQIKAITEQIVAYDMLEGLQGMGEEGEEEEEEDSREMLSFYYNGGNYLPFYYPIIRGGLPFKNLFKDKYED